MSESDNVISIGSDFRNYTGDSGVRPTVNAPR